MPGSAKILTLIVTVAAAIAFAACGGASGEGDAGVPPVEEELFVSNGVEVLSASADRFEQVITSTEGSMDMSVSGDGVEFGIAADFAFEAPDSMYVSMTMSGGDETNLFDPSALGEMEVLVRDGVFYTSMPFLGGWISMSLEGMGLTGDELQEALSGSAAFDYGALVDAFGGVEFAGEETIDGRDLIHYRVSAELSDALAALSGALDSVSGGVDGYVDPAISGPISMDVWVGAEDYLP